MGAEYEINVARTVDIRNPDGGVASLCSSQACLLGNVSKGPAPIVLVEQVVGRVVGDVDVRVAVAVVVSPDDAKALASGIVNA